MAVATRPPCAGILRHRSWRRSDLADRLQVVPTGLPGLRRRRRSARPQSGCHPGTRAGTNGGLEAGGRVPYDGRVSFDWTGRPSQPGRPDRSARSGRSGGRSTPLEAAQEARGALQEQFYRVDQFQSDIGGTVKLYAGLLPDRASRTGVVPGWAPLDQKANELIVAYLELLDRFDPLEDLAPLQQQEAHRAFSELTPKLGFLGNDMEGFLERFAPELQKVGEARERVESRIRDANAKVREAEAAWRQMDRPRLPVRLRGPRDRSGQDRGPQADRGRAAAQTGERRRGRPGRREACCRGSRPGHRPAAPGCHAEDPDPLAGRPDRRSGDQGRVRPRGDAGPPPRVLGRELAGSARSRAGRGKLLAAALRQQVRELRILHERGDLTAALTALSAIETTLEEAGALVDGPRERLSLLRQVREVHSACSRRLGSTSVTRAT